MVKMRILKTSHNSEQQPPDNTQAFIDRSVFCPHFDVCICDVKLNSLYSIYFVSRNVIALGDGTGSTVA